MFRKLPIEKVNGEENLRDSISDYAVTIQDMKCAADLKYKLNSLSLEKATSFLTLLIADEFNFKRLLTCSEVTNLLAYLNEDKIKHQLFKASISTYFNYCFTDAMSFCFNISILEARKQPNAITPMSPTMVNYYLNKFRGLVFNKSDILGHLLSGSKKNKSYHHYKTLLIEKFPNLAFIIANHEEIIKNARIFAEASRTGTSFFAYLPNELGALIAAETRDNKYSQKEALTVAFRNLNKPLV